SARWGILSLPSVLKHEVKLFYPHGLSIHEGGIDAYAHILNETFYPRCGIESGDTVTLLWTSTLKLKQNLASDQNSKRKQPSRPWVPDHFVPLLKKNVSHSCIVIFDQTKGYKQEHAMHRSDYLKENQSKEHMEYEYDPLTKPERIRTYTKKATTNISTSKATNENNDLAVRQIPQTTDEATIIIDVSDFTSKDPTLENSSVVNAMILSVTEKLNELNLACDKTIVKKKIHEEINSLISNRNRIARQKHISKEAAWHKHTVSITVPTETVYVDTATSKNLLPNDDIFNYDMSNELRFSGKKFLRSKRNISYISKDCTNETYSSLGTTSSEMQSTVPLIHTKSASFVNSDTPTSLIDYNGKYVRLSISESAARQIFKYNILSQSDFEWLIREILEELKTASINDLDERIIKQHVMTRLKVWHDIYKNDLTRSRRAGIAITVTIPYSRARTGIYKRMPSLVSV
ncbi:unnamed protein product, partial [Didymodactylos carnosus]